MNILIPNGPGIKNLGDRAIFESLISKLRQGGTDRKITAHCFEPQRFYHSKISAVRSNLYYWAIFHERKTSTRFTRCLLLLLALILPRPLDMLLSKKLNIILKDYKNADRVILMGGGYFRSQTGISQQLNAIMNGIPILFAKKYGKRISVRPISFGPFSSRVMEWLCAKMINLADKIFVRDDTSLDLLRRYIQTTKLKKEKDDAFLIKPVKVNKLKQRMLGFTVREWVDASKRKVFIENLAELIVKSANQYRCSVIQPIIQVDAPAYNEGDEKITNDLTTLIKEKGTSVRRTLKPKTVKQALNAYGKLSYLVGMRMHSCIFAHIQRVPFTAIAYEHKHNLLVKYDGEIVPLKDLTQTNFQYPFQHIFLKGAI